MTRLFLCLTVLISTCAACSKGDSGLPTNTDPPSNLTVAAVVNADNSGNVAFTASATNAITYDYDFGNGIFQTVPSGIVTYKYPAAGTYIVNVIAKSAAGKIISQSTTVTQRNNLVI